MLNGLLVQVIAVIAVALCCGSTSAYVVGGCGEDSDHARASMEDRGECCEDDEVSWIQLQVNLDSSGARFDRTEVRKDIQLQNSVASNSSLRTDPQVEPPALATATRNMGFPPSLSMALRTETHNMGFSPSSYMSLRDFASNFIAPNEVEDHGITEAIHEFLKASDPFSLTRGLYLLGITMTFVLVLSVVLTWKNSDDEDMPKAGESLWGGMEMNSLALSLFGNFLEWYDFGLYGYMVDPIGKAFFPFDDQFTRILVAFATFGGAFLLRPLGGAVFGYMGDRYGRVPALRIGLAGMVLCTSIIGVMPNAEQIGIAAPILVVLSRSLQGFFVGGTSTGGTVYVIESTKPSRQCLMSGMLGLTVNAGLASGSAVAALVVRFSTVYWCWRVPFASAALFGIVAGWASMNAEEAQPYAFAMECGQRTTFPEALSKYWDRALRMMGFAMLTGSAGYTLFTWMPTYQVVLKIFPLQCGFALNTAALAVVALSSLVWGWLADHGRFDILLGVAALMLTVLFPFILPLFDSQNAEVVSACYFVLGIISGPLVALTARWLVSQVPDATVRYLFIAVSFNLSIAIFGGFAPSLATVLLATPWGIFSMGLFLGATSLIGAYSILHKPLHKHV